MTRNRDDIVAAAFAAAGPKLEFDPLRAQKLLFLIDQVVSGRIGGPFFNFRPYLYDPFDRVVYDAIQNLVAAGYAQTDTAGPYNAMCSPTSGIVMGRRCLDRFRTRWPTTLGGRLCGCCWYLTGGCSRPSIASTRRWRRTAWSKTWKIHQNAESKHSFGEWPAHSTSWGR